MTKVTQSHSHSYTNTNTASTSDPCTDRFLPPRDWPDQTDKARDWMAEKIEHGISNRIKMEDRACIRAGPTVSER
ncbi:hypothetical protein I302_107276 [Kwoniella bestiolae CBS 10118]|uniref:Uncharacterized protein n=1 Tax=Kwoniella bestiolae CBS 10118 TaxID=1296100 RepID=A0A1B9FZ03_9TREE|nr:hypothetical protein I302_06988 [Kwoniella bestiolae CBS 10118]OCF24002.1 hypothetical protein I302_06988 [Kwoniella bestiolae CBS 10118]